MQSNAFIYVVLHVYEAERTLCAPPCWQGMCLGHLLHKKSYLSLAQKTLNILPPELVVLTAEKMQWLPGTREAIHQ